MSKNITKFLIGLIAVLSAALFSSCGASKSWDYSKPMQPMGLAASPEIKFSGLEWTGKTYSQDSDGNTVNQSDIVRIGALPHHTVGTAVYDSVEKAIEGAENSDRSLSEYYKLLTGEGNVWQLAVYKNMDEASAAGVTDFYRTDYDMSSAPAYEGEDRIYSYSDAYYGGFREVTLPASWQTQGFDFPIYTNYIYPWNDGAYGNEKVYAPTIPTAMNPVGFYRYEFDVDPGWISENRRVYISFGGVESAYYVYLNGHAVGYSEDTFDAADFDITPYLNADGKGNILCVEVHRWCDGSYFENQDFMRLAGIFRDVYLYSTPSVRISDYTAVTELDGNYKNGTLNLEIEVQNTSDADIENGEFGVCAELYDAERKLVLSEEKSVSAAASGQSSAVKLTGKLKDVNLWSDETPYLYTLVITLYDNNGAYYGSLSQRLGFREIEFTPTKGTEENESYSQVLLNGKPLILKGVNRHETNPEAGRYIPRELSEKDVQIMKSLNINAVRTSHYPDSEYFYDMCDKYGILVLGECNVETHYNVSADDTEKYFKNVVRDRIEAHTKAYKNRTSIVIWSMGNETIAGSETFLNCIQELKQRDPTRPIHFESQGSKGGVDISSTMYSSVDDAASRGTWENHMPYLMCEYAHAMGNSVGNLYEYWRAFRQNDNILGGFIWDFVDQSIWTEIPSDGVDFYGNGKFLGYGGTWGDNPNSGDFCQNGIISADRDIQPEAQEVKYVYQSVWFNADRLSETNKTVNIYNEFRFKNLSEFEIGYELLKDGEKIDEGTLEIDCAPLETVSIEVPYSYTRDGSEYLLTLYAKLKEDTLWGKSGQIISGEQFELAGKVDKYEPGMSSSGAVEVKDSDSAVEITAGECVITVSKTDASISYVYNGQEVIKSMKPNFKRARLSNDNINCKLDNARVSAVENFEVVKADDGKSVDINARLKLSVDGAYEDVAYTVYSNGEISVDMKLELPDDITEIYRFGTVFDLDKSFENIKYYGRGPADSYLDRQRGAFAGIYSQTVSESFYPYGNPQDTGNKTGVRWFELSDSQGITVRITSEDDTIEASALHYTPAEIERARYPYQVPKDPASTYLYADYKNRGTGGASCGPEPLNKYKVERSDRLEYSFCISVNG